MPRKAQGGLDVLDMERVLIDDNEICVATLNEGRKIYVYGNNQSKCGMGYGS